MKKPTHFRVRFVEDPDAAFEECNGEARPLTEAEYAENYYLKDGARVSYEDYLAYYGNPERHVYLQCDVEKQCPCCQHWEYETGTGGIDFMDDDPELSQMDEWYTPDQVLTLPGYLREVATEDLREAGWTPPKHVHCQHKGCKYWHQVKSRHQPDVDERYCAQHQPKPATDA